MDKQTVQAAVFRKKPYAKPFIKVHQMKPAGIICTSGEKYQLGNTDDWYQKN